MSTTQCRTEDEDVFWRKLLLPQEERMRLGIHWHGGYRWFRSPNDYDDRLRRPRWRNGQP